MTQLIIATGNKGKIKEIKEILSDIEILSLADIGFDKDISEPYHTFEENAYVKADTIHKHTQKNVFADDSGICVDALDGAPGVLSARYSGQNATDTTNLDLLLNNMHGIENRHAHYAAVICLIWNGEAHYFKGTCKGTILTKPKGNGGFGYDPIFVPDGYEETFAELPAEIKNSISHRGKAIREMAEFLKEHK